ncbi:hypothetical protein [Anaerotignum propionicum]|uniref:hypothetical protein n=1 Tax=Anaerotignum propionicum TaxID=28446 RepID=UPI00210C4391|nr:hypothetical protein [Anaerotignum propionicum]MCQ4936731.1 hypothetical protein [Anaerotignum propionicum]
MKYDFLFKLNCVELYRNKQWTETPKGIGQKNFRKRIVSWEKIADIHGIDALRHPSTCKERTKSKGFLMIINIDMTFEEFIKKY